MRSGYPPMVGSDNAEPAGSGECGSWFAGMWVVPVTAEPPFQGFARRQAREARVAKHERNDRTPPLAAKGARLLAQRGTGAAVAKAKLPEGGEIQLLGVSKVQPGHAKSWAADGTPIPFVLPFATAGGLPVSGGVERQALIRYPEGAIVGLNGYFETRPNADELQGGTPPANTMPVPARLEGDRLVAVRQGFDSTTNKADLVLRYFKKAKTFAKSRVVDRVPQPGQGALPTEVMAGRDLDLGSSSLSGLPALRPDTVLLAMNVPEELDGKLRVSVTTRTGRYVPAYSLGAYSGATWKREPSLAPERRSVWFLPDTTRASEIVEIRYARTEEGSLKFRSVKLNPVR